MQGVATDHGDVVARSEQQAGTPQSADPTPSHNDAHNPIMTVAGSRPTSTLRSAGPTGTQPARDLRSAIESGILSPGDALPAEKSARGKVRCRGQHGEPRPYAARDEGPCSLVVRPSNRSVVGHGSGRLAWEPKSDRQSVHNGRQEH